MCAEIYFGAAECSRQLKTKWLCSDTLLPLLCSARRSMQLCCAALSWWPSPALIAALRCSVQALHRKCRPLTSPGETQKHLCLIPSRIVSCCLPTLLHTHMHPHTIFLFCLRSTGLNGGSVWDREFTVGVTRFYQLNTWPWHSCLSFCQAFPLPRLCLHCIIHTAWY